MQSKAASTVVRCPTCGKRGTWFEARYGPFCSERCKLVDLGKWFGEEHTISEPLHPEQLEACSDLLPDSPPGQAGGAR